MFVSLGWMFFKGLLVCWVTLLFPLEAMVVYGLFSVRWWFFSSFGSECFGEVC